MRLGERRLVKSTEWVREFKLALINEDKRALLGLCESTPESFVNKAELDEAFALTQQALTLMQTQKAELGGELAKLKKVRKYL